jgi:phosphoesterase RecJ-like protein
VNKILKTLLSTKRVLLVCHRDPDADTLCSALALATLLQQKKISSKIVCKDPVPGNLSVIPGMEKISTSLPKNWRADIVVAMEAGDSKRLGFDLNVDINIDHHFDNTRYGKLNWVDHKASALGSMIFQLAIAGRFKITPLLATFLYAAIFSDTGGLRFGNTSEQTYADMHVLVRHGAKPDHIYQMLYEQVAPETLCKLGEALCRMKTMANGRIIYSTVPQVTTETGHGIIDVLRTVRGAEIAVLFKEMSGKNVKVSLRSKNDFNVEAIAKKFGGGGHKKAAGCELDTTLDKAIKIVLGDIKKALAK